MFRMEIQTERFGANARDELVRVLRTVVARLEDDPDDYANTKLYDDNNNSIGELFYELGA